MPASIVIPPKHASTLPSQRHCLVYFITGNPGLIDYYEPFLSTLRHLIDSTDAPSDAPLFTLAGRDLLGFRDGDHHPFDAQHQPFDVEAQIKGTIAAIRESTIGSGPRSGQSFDDVILIGHSVGAFITLEIFQRHLHDPTLAHLDNLKAGFLLFPTVVHIAASSNGVRFTRLLQSIPAVGNNAHLVAKGLLCLVPTAVLRWVLGNIWNMPPHAVAVTSEWLMSRDGVHQTLQMALDEMRVIGEDKFLRELWDVSAERHEAANRAPSLKDGKETPKFFFLFGKNDHWVANEVRDKFIAEREEYARQDGPGKGRVRFEIDEDGRLPHDFCIRHSEIVAERVKLWIDELMPWV